MPPRCLLAWSLAYFSFAGGFVLLMLPMLGFEIVGSVLAANLLIDLGTVLNFLAVVTYLKRPWRDLWVLVPAGLLALLEIAYVAWHFENLRVMVTLGCALRGILTIAAGTALWQCPDESRRPVARLAAAIHGLWALILFCRILWWLLTPNAVVTVDPTSAFGLLSRLILTVAIIPCFLWMLMRQLDAELLRFASHDALTGLVNRRVVWERGTARAAQLAGQNAALAVILIDVDHFKNINDQWGHPAGDKVLIAVGRQLADTAGQGDLVGRIGGEEFLVLPAKPGEAAALAERLRAAVAALQISVDGGQTLHCTISLGVAAADEGAFDWQQLVGNADAALYAAKEAGRNRVVSAEPKFGSPGLERKALVRTLR